MLPLKTETLFFELALTLYFIATIIGIIGLFKGRKETFKTILVLAIIGFIFHTVNIVIRYIEGGHIPITNLHEGASFFTWCIVVLFLLLEFRYKIGFLGSFIMPIVFVLMLSSSVLPRGISPSLKPVLKSYWLGIHTLFSFFGDG